VNTDFSQRESPEALPNPLGLDGIEYIEYATAKPQALGHVLEAMGFRPIARHRSREVLLYRQGSMNLIVNGAAGTAHGASADAPPRISAIALRVRDARAAYARVVERGGWDVPMHAQPMELNIPGIHGPGGSHIYFVDRYREFSIYDVDFTLIPGVDPKPPAVCDLHYFGIVQYVGVDRTADWLEFYRELFQFDELPDEERFGILPKGKVMRSPCGQFYLQLIEPPAAALASAGLEHFQRIGLGTRDVLATVARLRANRVDFVDTPSTHAEARGALTQPALGAVMFELVHDERAGAGANAEAA